MTDWQGIGAQIAQTGTALRFTGKNAHAIMVMLKVVPTTLDPFHFQGICILQVLFFCTEPAPRKGLPAFPYYTTFHRR